MISKEKIEKRKAELLKQAEELKANLQAVSGAIQLCDLLLSELSTPSDPTTTPKA